MNVSPLGFGESFIAVASGTLAAERVITAVSEEMLTPQASSPNLNKPLCPRPSYRDISRIVFCLLAQHRGLRQREQGEWERGKGGKGSDDEKEEEKSWDF